MKRNVAPPQSYVVLVSSVQPIELAAIVALHQLRQFRKCDRLLILIDDDLTVPAEPLRRVFAPRASLPLPYLFAGQEETFRQLFVPLETPGEGRIEAPFECYLQAWLALLGTHLPRSARRRMEALATVVRTNLDTDNSPSRYLQLVVRTILSSVLSRSVDLQVLLYSEFLDGVTGQEAVLNALVAIGCEVLEQRPVAAVRFAKGGFLEVRSRSVSEHSYRLDNFRETSNGFTLSGKFGVRLEYKIRGAAWSMHVGGAPCEMGLYHFTLRGPLVMAFLNQIGIPLDVPWYAEHVQIGSSRTGGCSGIEVISPVSSVSRHRASLWAGGDGIRVKPAGYSLLDYNHPRIQMVVDRIAAAGHSSPMAYDDWRHLLENYPATKQKALKSQAGTREYCQLRTYEYRRMIKAGGVEPLCIVADLSQDSHPAKLGIRGLALLTLLKYAADTTATPAVTWTDKQLELLKNLGLARSGVIAKDGFSHMTHGLISESTAWRHQIAFPSTVFDQISTQDAVPLVAAFLSRTDTAFESPERSPDVSQHDLRKLHRLLQAELVLYYKGVLAVCALVLKAELFVSWFLLGPREYRRVCDELLSRRNGDSLLQLRTRLWEEGAR